MAVSSKTYRTLCLPKVKDFINEHYCNDEVIFWPDLASAHYAKETLAVMNDLSIPFVPKENNPPNCPQLRPIENFWAILKRKVYAGGYVPANIDALQQKIERTIKSIEIEVFEALFANLPKKIRKASEVGPQHFCR